jgi:hypothetical protein
MKWIVLIAFIGLTAGQGAEPPVIPVGSDAYRQWDRWPYQRIGVRAYMRSTYDRSGGNEGADASHFLYQLSETNNVALDVAGPGILYFARYNHWHGSPWNYRVDDVNYTVQESSTRDPDHPVQDAVFLPAESFPTPLAVTWSATKGADLSWVPIAFERSFRMDYARTHYGTGYYIYDQYVGGTRLSRPIRSWRAEAPDADVLELFQRSGFDVSPPGAARLENMVETLGANAARTIFFLTNAPGLLRKLAFSISTNQALTLGGARLRITWDGRKDPSVDAPLALFFGAGTYYNRDAREYLVKAFPVFVRFGPETVESACFFPMPWFKSARIELIGPTNGAVTNIHCEARWQSLSDPPAELGYFHASYRDHPQPELGRDLVLLDTSKVEGGGDWSGSFIGTSLIFSERAYLGTLEGDPRFFFDDSQTPQAQGTGTEEWCGGGDYWGGLNMTLPFAGHPAGAVNLKRARNELDKIETAYRFLLGDLMPFGKKAVIGLEHGGRDESTEHYQTVAYWYGAPAPSLVKTDELKVGDDASERKHQYRSPQASAPYEITSRYELGVDTAYQSRKDKVGFTVYPPHTDIGRKTSGWSEFALRLNPANFGVLLRRKLDYSFPNQRAQVYVADTDTKEGEPGWKLAGTWYLAGGNTCVYSNPAKEMGASQPVLQTSNRRFRDDEFLVPRSLTEGRTAIRIRVEFTPVKIPLLPGGPLPELAWSEIRYDAYCFVIPQWQPGDPVSAP